MTYVHAPEAEHTFIHREEDVQTHLRRLNNIFCKFFSVTHFHQDLNYEVPWCRHSVNDDGTINVDYQARDGQMVVDDGLSYFYTINHDGTIYCKTSDELLDLKNIVHLMGVVSTMIRDIYGEFDDQKAFQDHIDLVCGKEDN